MDCSLAIAGETWLKTLSMLATGHTDQMPYTQLPNLVAKVVVNAKDQPYTAQGVALYTTFTACHSIYAITRQSISVG